MDHAELGSEGEAVAAEIDQPVVEIFSGGKLHDQAHADDGFAIRRFPVIDELLSCERRRAVEVHRESQGGVRPAVPVHAGRRAVEQAAPGAALIGLEQVETGGLAEQFEGMDVFGRDGIQLELAVLDAQHRIEGDVSLRVGIRAADEIRADRKMAPAARLDVLGECRQRRQQR